MYRGEARAGAGLGGGKAGRAASLGRVHRNWGCGEGSRDGADLGVAVLGIPSSWRRPHPHVLPAPRMGGHRCQVAAASSPAFWDGQDRICAGSRGGGGGGEEPAAKQLRPAPSLDLPRRCAALSSPAPSAPRGARPCLPGSAPQRAGHLPSPVSTHSDPPREHLLSSGRPTWREWEGHEDRASRVPGGGEAPSPCPGPAPAWHRCG